MKRFFARLWHSPTFTTWGSFSVSFLALLLITPLVLTRFSTEVLAVWFLFAVLIGFIQLADFGFTPTFVRLTAFTMGGATDLRDFRDSKKKGSGKPNWEVMEKLYGNMGYIYIFSTVFVFFLASILGTRILEKPISYTNNVEELYSAWYIIIAGLTLSFYGRKYQAILQGMNYIALVNRVNILFGLIGIGASFLVLVLDGTILQLVIAQQFFSVLGAIRGWLILRNIEQKRFRKFKIFSYDKQIFEAAWSPAWRSAIVILGSTGVIQMTGMIYAQVADASSLAAYLFALKLITVSSNISRAPFYSKIPLFARLRAEGNLQKLTDLTARAMFLSLSVFIIVTFSILIFAPALLLLIKSNVIFIDNKVWLLMVIVWLLERHHGMHAQIYATTNKIPFYIPVLITGIINIVLILLLLESFGIWAFPVAQGISNLLFNNWWNVKISLKSIDQTFFKYYKIMLNNIFSSLIKKLHIASYLLKYRYYKIRNYNKKSIFVFSDSRGYNVLEPIRKKDPFHFYLNNLVKKYNVDFFVCPEKHTTIMDFFKYYKNANKNYDIIILHALIVDISPRIKSTTFDIYNKKIVLYDEIFGKHNMHKHLNSSFNIKYEEEYLNNMFSLKMATNYLIPKLKKIDNLIWISSNNFVDGWKGDYPRERPSNIKEVTEAYNRLFINSLPNVINISNWTDKDIKENTIDNIHFTKKGKIVLENLILKKIKELD